MIYLVLAILTNGLIGIIFKIFGQRDINLYFAILVNYFVCVLMASIVMGKWAVPFDSFGDSWILLALGLGILFPIIFNIYGQAVKNLGIVVSTIFQKMSLIAPVLVGILFYVESWSGIKITGIILAILAIFLIPKETGDSGFKINSKYVYLGALIFLGSALIDTGLYLKDKLFIIGIDDLSFTATLFFFAGISSVPLFLFNRHRTKSEISRKDLWAGLVLGIPNFFAIYLILLGLNYTDGSVFFPINNVGILLVSGIAGIFLFKENMNKYKYLGFFFSILAIILLQL